MEFDKIDSKIWARDRRSFHFKPVYLRLDVLTTKLRLPGKEMWLENFSLYENNQKIHWAAQDFILGYEKNQHHRAALSRGRVKDKNKVLSVVLPSHLTPKMFIQCDSYVLIFFRQIKNLQDNNPRDKNFQNKFYQRGKNCLRDFSGYLSTNHQPTGHAWAMSGRLSPHFPTDSPSPITELSLLLKPLVQSDD